MLRTEYTMDEEFLCRFYFSNNIGHLNAAWKRARYFERVSQHRAENSLLRSINFDILLLTTRRMRFHIK